ncbi:hypothetical protein LPY66_16600 [Dehalobacter sp. DCM]|uniref:complex I subunit 5 family protein n=1 Tax=Dehalobacter sp. DCM TaxID=2907827 RepID=UPI0030817935|nr:hypothetical protein LPY66_16600 [Dehalobacter sp. DCM]
MNDAIISSAVFLILILTACLVLLVKNWRQAGLISLLAVIIAGVGMTVMAVRVFLSGEVDFVFARQIAGFPAVLSFRMDHLSALFVLLIAFLSTCSVIYAQGFMQVFRQENPGRYYAPFLLFVTGMYGVVVSADLFFFILFWEMMTLFSYFLVVFENKSPAKLKAGFTYFIVTQATSIGLIFASAILYSYTGSLRLSELTVLFQGLAQTHPAVLHLILALFFIGFGAKAGVFPLGFWMPEAYAAAPASATAVFSGVMSKMGVYGILRVFVWLLPAADIAATWGFILATFGVLSMLIGNLRTLYEVDSKRLLAQSSIGQMGYILLGIGAGLCFRTSAPFLSVLALIGAIYHVINHGLFKSLLFFNTGSILYRTGTNDLNQVGGLVKLMPAACAVGLVGSLAISGMPPFNGFVSKWLLYQASIFGGTIVPLFALYGIIAIFISTVSLAAYLKYMGTAYLGILPEKFSAGPKGQPFSMEAVQILLAAGCILLGLIPGLPVQILYSVVAGPAADGASQAGILNSLAWGGGTVIGFEGSIFSSGYTPLILLAALLLGILISWGLSRVYKVPVQPAEVWSCGEKIEDELIRYRAAGFYASFAAYLPFLNHKISWPKWKLPRSLTVVLDLDRWFYFPIGKRFMQFAGKFSQTHRGRPQLYLLWQVIGIGLFFLGLFWLMGVK